MLRKENYFTYIYGDSTENIWFVCFVAQRSQPLLADAPYPHKYGRTRELNFAVTSRYTPGRPRVFRTLDTAAAKCASILQQAGRGSDAGSLVVVRRNPIMDDRDWEKDPPSPEELAQLAFVEASQADTEES
jgi:hypothetical protein